MARQTDDQDKWCIIRTSGGRTLPLARSLTVAGFDVWTPTRTLKRPKTGARPDSNGRRPMVEVDAPIIPSFVFARSRHILDLLAASNAPLSPHPDFHLVRRAERVPLVAERSLAGLRLAEQEALEMINRLRGIEDADAKRRARAELLRTQAQRRKAMRKERRDFKVGELVTLQDAPAFAGMTGVVESSDGATAWIAFGGLLRVIVEAWQVIPDQVQVMRPVIGIAA